MMPSNQNTKSTASNNYPCGVPALCFTCFLCYLTGIFTGVAYCFFLIIYVTQFNWARKQFCNVSTSSRHSYSKVMCLSAKWWVSNLHYCGLDWCLCYSVSVVLRQSEVNEVSLGLRPNPSRHGPSRSNSTKKSITILRSYFFFSFLHRTSWNFAYL